MYAVYHYNEGASASNIISDVAALLTGETNLNNLSAACNAGLSEIYTSWSPAGWTMHDASPGLGSVSRVIKAPFNDNPTQYKYVGIVYSSDASFQYIAVRLYEDWSAAGHAGSNMAYRSDATGYAQRILPSQAGGGKIFISASPRHVVLAALYGAIWGSYTGQAPCGAMERTRWAGFDTPAAGFPPVVWGNFFNFTYSTGYYESMPRILSYLGTEVTGAGAVARFGHSMMSPGGGDLPSGVYGDYPDGASGRIVPFYPLEIKNPTLLPVVLGEVSSLCEVWHLPAGMGVNLDEIIVDGHTYVLWKQEDGVNGMIAVRKG